MRQGELRLGRGETGRCETGKGEGRDRSGQGEVTADEVRIGRGVEIAAPVFRRCFSV